MFPPAMRSWTWLWNRLARLLGVVAVMATAGGCSGGSEVWPADHPGPKVVASFAPLYCFALNVAGEDAVVRPLMTTSGPHHFNPTDKDARLLRQADLFLINGLGLEGDRPEKLRQASNNSRLQVVDVSNRIPPAMLCEGSCCHHEEGTEEEEHSHEHGHDPHVWLSPEYAIWQVEVIRDALIERDPAHAEAYRRRAQEYITRLRQLTDYGRTLLQDKKDRQLVTFHESLAYFAKTFQLNVVGVVQKNPGVEPSDKQLKKLIALCADEKRPVRVISVEPQYSNSHSGHELVKELQRRGVPEPVLVEIDTLETAPLHDLTPDWYERRMRANLEALAKALR
ncbi:MAG: metal ABC transporter substrate-binding protein [Thermogemmata sp.]